MPAAVRVPNLRTVLPGAEGGEVDREASELAEFLNDRAEAIASRATSTIVGGLPLLGLVARRRLRRQLADQLHELARHLATYGKEGPRLYGESQRRYAAARLAQGLELHDALQERAVVQDSIFEVWASDRGSLPIGHARLLALAFAEVSSQASEVWLTYQRAETVAFQEAALLDTIVHHLDEAILVVEPDGTLSYATPAFEEITGVPARLVVGVSAQRVQDVLAPLDMRDEAGEPIAREDLPHVRALRTHRVEVTSFIRIRRLDRREVILELYAAPVFADEGQLRGVVVTIRDRTQSWEQTAALTSAYAELQRMHAHLLGRSRLEAIGELAGSTAHTLNNQLNVITLRLRHLLDMKDARKDAEGIQRSVREIANLVARLQEFASAPRTTEPVATPPARAIRRAIGLLRARAGAGTGIEIPDDLEALPEVIAEPNELVEFLTTLLLSARDATPPSESVEIEAEAVDEQVVVRVIDGGATLTPAQVEQLFEPLQAEEAERAGSLALARQALERGGGGIQVRPRAQGGNEIEIRLRRSEDAGAKEARAEQPRSRESAAIVPTMERILVVDDDRDNADMLADLLRDEGGKVEVARTIDEAVERAEAFEPQAALVDLVLGEESGWDLVRTLRERWPSMKIAVVSGLAVRDAERQVKGADAAFRKPVDTQGLLDFLGL